MIPISNGKDTLLTANTGSVPNVSGAMRCWFQPMSFVRVAKIVKNFKVVETPTVIDFLGVVDPNDQPLEMMERGQRAWDSFNCYTQIGVPLFPDDVVIYLGVQYRVLNKYDFAIYGYLKYALKQDFTGSGPV